jgi:hypothetical protein
MTEFIEKLKRAVDIASNTDVGSASDDHQGFVSSGFGHSGFDAAANQVFKSLMANDPRRAISPSRFTGRSPAQNAASAAATSRALDRIRNGMNSVQIAQAIVDEAKAGLGINFHDATVRRALSDKIAKAGGRVGYLVTGERVLAEYMKASRPNSSSGKLIKVPILERTLRQEKNPQDRVIAMLKNIADQGYVLQQAKGK